MSTVNTTPCQTVKLAPGVCIPFGPTFWRVLDIDRQARTALVIADRPICNKVYHQDKWEDITWEKCTLRAWLNGDFYEKKFTDAEKAAILTTHVDNSKAQGYPTWNTDGGNDTEDKLFLLSYAEAWTYFKTDAERKSDRWWWLRSPGSSSSSACSVSSHGARLNNSVRSGYGAVRPAFQLNLESDIFKSLIQSESENGIELDINRAFHVAKKLPDSYAEYVKNCTLEEYAWCLMYQKGKAWDAVLPKKVTQDNAVEILRYMTEHIAGLKKSMAKAAKTAIAYVVKYVAWMTAEAVNSLCDTLRSQKCAALADELAADPFVAVLLKAMDAKTDESGMRVCADGTVLDGFVWNPLQVGATFSFGSSPVPWRILDIHEEEQTALVIADRPVCKKAYHDEWGHITWEKCTLRAWLNGEYLQQTFSAEEQEAIMVTHVDNSKAQGNPEWNTDGGNDTEDKVFLLSYAEAWKYFKTDEERKSDGWWWLRSPGDDQNSAADVDTDGSLSISIVLNTSGCVCPAFKINLESDIFKSFTKTAPDGTRLISARTMAGKAGVLNSICSNEKAVVLPAWVKKVAAGAIRNRKKLETLTWADTMPKFDKDAIENCPKLKLPAEFYKGKVHENFASYMPDDGHVMAAMLLGNKKTAPWLEGAAKNLTLENADALLREMLTQATAAEKLPLEAGNALLRVALACAGCVEKQLLKDLYSLLESKGLTNGMGWLKAELDVQPEAVPEVWLKAMTVEEKLLTTAASSELHFAKVLQAANGYGDWYWLSWIKASEYKKGALKYKKQREADTLAAAMPHEALMNQLLAWKEAAGDRWLAPYAAFADEARLETLIKELNGWAKEGKTGKERMVRVRGAILLNDTVAAMRYADSLGLLGRYAEMRGTDEDTLRESFISDFGLDAEGKKTWTLGGVTYTATLEHDLTVTLTDGTGKVLKSLPKKGADPAEYDATAKEFAALKKDIKATAKLRNDKLFEDFLSGKSRTADLWKRSFMTNPLLKALARLVVWAQDDKTFTLHDDGLAYTADGSAYTVTDSPVKVAHPMEMQTEDLQAWQQYFMTNSLKQPFEQVWEPVVDATMVRPGRYDGCTIELYHLMNKDKHGIIMKGQREIELKDCSADLEYKEGHKDWVHNLFEVKNFSFKAYTRQVNHIVVLLDKGTVAGRIQKDDVTVAQWLDWFTLAQITEFINLATTAEAHNVTALLLEYKQQHYPDTDAFSEFTLEW